ncbi:hypothetical protein KM043_002694 [Ampulex compressa]|nr:hypothetical protein KM043_002694 [Ampulex compressa]
MDSVLKAGRSLGNGVCRAAGALARGTRRVFASIPLLGVIAAPQSADDTEPSVGGEEAESGSATAGSPVEEKSAASSPTAEKEVAPASPASPAASEAKEEAAVVAASPAASSPLEEKKEEPTPSAPTPVPLEDKKEEVEKVEAEKKVVEVSPAGGQLIEDPVEVFRVQPVATPSIIERKTTPAAIIPPTSFDSPTDEMPFQRSSSKPSEGAVGGPPSLAGFPTDPVQETRLELPDKKANEGTTGGPGSSIGLETDLAEERNSGASRVASEDARGGPVVDSLKDENEEGVASSLETRSEMRSFESPLPSSKDLVSDMEALKLEASPVVDEGTGAPARSAGSLGDREKEAMGSKDADRIEKIEVLPTECARRFEDIETLPESNAPDASRLPNADVESKEEESIKTALETTEKEASRKDEVVSAKISMEQVADSSQDYERESEQPREMILEYTEIVIDSEEGPVPVTEEMLVEAKPALVIPEDEWVEVRLEGDEERTKSEETTLETAPPTEEVPTSKEPERLEAEGSATKAAEQERMPAPLSVSPVSSFEGKQNSGEQSDELEDMPPPPMLEAEPLASPLLDKQSEKVEAESAGSIEDILPEKVEDESASSLTDIQMAKVEEKPESFLPNIQPEKVEESPSSLMDIQSEKVEEEPESLLPNIQPEKFEEELESFLPNIQPEKVEEEPESLLPNIQPKFEESPSSLTNIQPEKVEEESASLLTNIQPEKVEESASLLTDTQPEKVEEESANFSPDIQPEKVEAEHAEGLSSRETEPKIESSLSTASPHDPASRLSAMVASPIDDEGASPPALEARVPSPSSRLSSTSVPTEELPPAPESPTRTTPAQKSPEKLSCPETSDTPEATTVEFQICKESATDLISERFAPVTPPKILSPCPYKRSMEYNDTRPQIDHSDIQSCREQSTALTQLRMESVSISPDSYNDSEIELKDRLAESSAETKIQEGTLSCQLSNSATSATGQETHQVTNMQHNILA